MKICILTLFPEFFDSPLEASVLGRAQAAGCLSVERMQIRDFAEGRHRTTDDTPYGGGAGMVLRATELGAATEAAHERLSSAPVLYLSPQGRRLEQSDVRRLARMPELVIVCGRYEGVDERWIEEHVDAEVSLGDFVLSGGEPAALVLIDAVARLLPGALGNAESPAEESFAEGALEYPHFTRPASYAGVEVPEVLTSGDHGRVAAWRAVLSSVRTASRRPDLMTEDERAAAFERAAELDVPAWLYRRRHLEDLEADLGEDRESDEES